ncbi:MAG: TolC family protein, partial [Nanoarchaeota archaeon]|nr:TolC family protein [Nanoarchaeota archaeon]
RYSANSTQAKFAGEHFRQLLINPLILRYHLDFWGRDQAALEAAVGKSLAVETELADAKLLLAVAVAGSYFDLVAASEKLVLAEKIVADREALLSLHQTRLASGLVTAAPLLQAKMALNAAQQIEEATVRSKQLFYIAIGTLIIGLLLLAASVIGCVREEAMTEQKAIEMTRETEEMKAFLEFYGKCDGCNPSYSQGHANLVGCVEYSIGKDAGGNYIIRYWVSDACSFRYGSSAPQEKIEFAVDSRTGKVLSKHPDLKYIDDPGFCKKDEDCLCKSGSGVPFIGCGNFLHAPAHFAGAYKCEKCICMDGSCKARE